MSTYVLLNLLNELIFFVLFVLLLYVANQQLSSWQDG